MTGLLDSSRVRGAIHSLPHIDTLDADDCNALFVSSRSLYILQNLAILDAAFVTRYATEFVDNTLYEPAVVGETSGDKVIEMVSNLATELGPVTCDLVGVLRSIQQTLASTDCGCNVGEGADTESTVAGGPVPRPIGSVVFEEPAAVSERTCKAANWIWETILNIFTDLEPYNIGLLAGTGFSIALATVVAVVAAAMAPISAVFTVVAGLLAAFVGRYALGGFSVAAMITALDAERNDLICILADSTDSEDARDDFLAHLTAFGLSSAETGLIRLLMPNSIMALLFFDTPESAAFWPTYTQPYDCSGCIISCTWAFIESGGSPLGSGSLTVDGGTRTLSSVPNAGGHTMQMNIPGPACDTFNLGYEIFSVSGWTNWATSSNDSFCHNSSGGNTLLWTEAPVGDPPPMSIVWDAGVLRLSSLTAFTVDIALYAGLLPPC